MKFSVEAKVAAAVAAGFIALAAVAIGQGGSDVRTGEASDYAVTENFSADTRALEQGYSLLPGDIDSEDESSSTVPEEISHSQSLESPEE